MLKFILGAAVGAGGAYSLINYFSPTADHSLGHEQHQMVNAYIHNHKLEKMIKQSVMNGYMQINKAFLDYGLRLRLDGFYFYGTYFEKDEMDSNKLSKGHCIFSPKEQLCGHPNIQHGGATATIADQNSGIVAMLYTRELVATAEMHIKYTKPVKKGQLYVWSGQVEKRQDRKVFVKSTVSELQTGAVCAQCDALMMTVNWQHKMGEVFHLLFQQDSKAEKVGN